MSRRRRCLSGMDLAILVTIHDHPCHGLGHLADCIEASRRRYVRSRVEMLAEAGLIDLDVPPVFGRGHRIVIRSRHSG